MSEIILFQQKLDSGQAPSQEARADFERWRQSANEMCAIRFTEAIESAGNVRDHFPEGSIFHAEADVERSKFIGWSESARLTATL